MPKLREAPKAKKERKVVLIERPVRYPTIEICGVEIPLESFRITVARAKELLGWENEDEFYERLKKDDPEVSREACTFEEEYLFLDEDKRKVRCWNNVHNRPFTMGWARSIAQDILNRKWHLNLETIIISSTGAVLSGQHRL